MSKLRITFSWVLICAIASQPSAFAHNTRAVRDSDKRDTMPGFTAKDADKRVKKAKNFIDQLNAIKQEVESSRRAGKAQSSDAVSPSTDRRKPASGEATLILTDPVPGKETSKPNDLKPTEHEKPAQDTAKPSADVVVVLSDPTPPADQYKPTLDTVKPVVELKKEEDVHRDPNPLLRYASDPVIPEGGTELSDDDTKQLAQFLPNAKAAYKKVSAVVQTGNGTRPVSSRIEFYDSIGNLLAVKNVTEQPKGPNADGSYSIITGGTTWTDAKGNLLVPASTVVSKPSKPIDDGYLGPPTPATAEPETPTVPTTPSDPPVVVTISNGVGEDHLYHDGHNVAVWFDGPIDLSKTTDLVLTFPADQAGAKFLLKLKPAGSTGDTDGLINQMFTVPVGGGKMTIPVPQGTGILDQISIHSGESAFGIAINAGPTIAWPAKVEGILKAVTPAPQPTPAPAPTPDPGPVSDGNSTEWTGPVWDWEVPYESPLTSNPYVPPVANPPSTDGNYQLPWANDPNLTPNPLGKRADDLQLAVAQMQQHPDNALIIPLYDRFGAPMADINGEAYKIFKSVQDLGDVHVQVLSAGFGEDHLYYDGKNVAVWENGATFDASKYSQIGFNFPSDQSGVNFKVSLTSTDGKAHPAEGVYTIPEGGGAVFVPTPGNVGMANVVAVHSGMEAFGEKLNDGPAIAWPTSIYGIQ